MAHNAEASGACVAENKLRRRQQVHLQLPWGAPMRHFGLRRHIRTLSGARRLRPAIAGALSLAVSTSAGLSDSLERVAECPLP